MPLINLGRDLGSGITDRHGIRGKALMGVVVDVEDPLKLQRVKIRVHDLHKEISDDDLPWSMPGQASKQHQGSGALGQIQVPPLKTKVSITYADDSMYHGFYEGTTTTADTKIPEFVGKGKGGGLGGILGDILGFAGGGDLFGMGDFQEWFEPEKLNPQKGAQLMWAKDYPDNYPKVGGVSDHQGSAHAICAKDKTYEYMHVTGTHMLIDGKGNTLFKVSNDGNGKAKLENPSSSGGAGGAGGTGGTTGGTGGQQQQEPVKGFRIESVKDGKAWLKGEGDLFAKGKMTIHTDDECVIYAKKDITIYTDATLKVKAKVICMEASEIKMVGKLTAKEILTPKLTATQVLQGAVTPPTSCNAQKPKAPTWQDPKRRGDPEPESYADGNPDY